MVGFFFLFVLTVEGCYINDALVKKSLDLDFLFWWDESSTEIGVKLSSGDYLRLEKNVLCSLTAKDKLVIFLYVLIKFL